MKYKDYILEQKEKIATFTFGRFNPPTIGHLKLAKAVELHSQNKSDMYIFVSNSVDPQKNPLQPNDKIKWMKFIMPKYAANIFVKSDIRNALDASIWLYDRGYNSIRLVVGSDRVKEFKTLLNKYNGVETKNGFYKFQMIEIISAGDRDPDAQDVSGMSASKMRQAVANNDFDKFKSGLPKNFTKAQELFLDVKRGMNL